MFIPQPDAPKGGAAQDDYDYENEPPLLEELGINFDHIRQKTFAVLNPVGTASAEVIADQDLAGPLVFCLLFGASLLLHGKVIYRYIICEILKNMIQLFSFNLVTFMVLVFWDVLECIAY